LPFVRKSKSRSIIGIITITTITVTMETTVQSTKKVEGKALLATAMVMKSNRHYGQKNICPP
jgi:hypothetical protein